MRSLGLHHGLYPLMAHSELAEDLYAFVTLLHRSDVMYVARDLIHIASCAAQLDHLGSVVGEIEHTKMSDPIRGASV